MTLRDYFQNTRGTGVLATADADGIVDMAIYSRPHFLANEDNEVAFIMNDHRSHENINANPHAAYLFMAEMGSYVGKRLYLTKTKEETDPDRIQAIRREDLPPECDMGGTRKKFLVHFRVDDIRPLIGSGKEERAAACGVSACTH